ncbi:MAG: hypothetical protein R6U41_09160 [Desulfosalsimonas sp.]
MHIEPGRCLRRNKDPKNNGSSTFSPFWPRNDQEAVSFYGAYPDRNQRKTINGVLISRAKIVGKQENSWPVGNARRGWPWPSVQIWSFPCETLTSSTGAFLYPGTELAIPALLAPAEPLR